jgi:phosphoserine aminotransferase
MQTGNADILDLHLVTSDRPTASTFFFRSGDAAGAGPRRNQRDLLALPSIGMSILEISHRSAAFESIPAAAEPTCARSRHSGELQGAVSQAARARSWDGADEPASTGATADYIDSGSWGDKAIKEAKKVGTVNVAASTKAENYCACRRKRTELTPGAHVHMTSNTIEGTEYKTLPESATCRSSTTRHRTCSAARLMSRSTG